MININAISNNLENLGILDVILPLLLIFTIIYAVLTKIKLFHKQGTIIFSFIIATSVVTTHVLEKYPPCFDIVVIINNSIPKIAILMIGIVSFFLVLGIFGFQLNFLTRFAGWIGITSILYIIYIFLTSGGCSKFNLEIPFYEYLIFLIPVIIFIFLIRYITSGSSERGGGDDDDIY